MNHIKSLHIEGFKKFRLLDVQFNEHMNILVGENEAGKSTILDALKIVFNQQYRNTDKSILRDLFNNKDVEYFLQNPQIDTLPRIIIEAELELDPHSNNSDYFYGEVHGDRKSQDEKFGICFECKYDEELGKSIESSISEGKIPYEYYNMTWTTFANRPYQMVKRPLNFLSIDTSSHNTTSFNYYNKTLFESRYDESTRIKAKNDFRTKLEEAFESTKLPPLNDTRKFGIDSKKVILETILSVYEDSVSLENRGSGMESLIKTQIALDRSSHLDVILIEEPENHLCFSSLHEMLEKISDKQDKSQLIITTHNNMIASRLNLNNVLWIENEKINSLRNVDTKIAEFFVKANNNAFLQLLLSKKIFLVEGTTEFLLIPMFYKQITGNSIEKDGVSVISCNGISYKNYLEIANTTNKRIAVITDNDGKIKKIDEAEEFNRNNTLQHIFMDRDINCWTWEVCIYNKNKKFLESKINTSDNKKYLYHNQDCGKVLGKMLNNKVAIAYQMLISKHKFIIPQYVKDAIKWLKK